MSADEEKRIILRYLDETWNKKNSAFADRVIGPDLIQHVRSVAPGREGIIKFFQMIYDSFPDARLNMDDLFAEGDMVAWRFTVLETHLAPFRGILASGKAITITGIAITRMKEGQMVENWNIPGTSVAFN